MSKLNVVLSDSDKNYAEALEQYFDESLSERFQVSCFTDKASLRRFLDNCNSNIDILLTSVELAEDLEVYQLNTVIILDSGRIPSSLAQYKTVNKYQTAERIASSIIEIYAENNPEDIFTNYSGKKTKTICAFSPNGGAGKTSILLALAARFSQRGNAVFYLNLEEVPTTQAFFESVSEHNLSRIFYFLKENKNLGLKIESSRIVDSQTGIHYFAPPDNIYEFNELFADEIEQLIKQLISLNYYDYLFIDISSSINERNERVLQISNLILNILTMEISCEIKNKQLGKYFDVISNGNSKRINDKKLTILNRSDERPALDTEFEEGNANQYDVMIPKSIDFMEVSNHRIGIDLNNEFGEAINNLATMIIQKTQGELQCKV